MTNADIARSLADMMIEWFAGPDPNDAGDLAHVIEKRLARFTPPAAEAPGQEPVAWQDDPSSDERWMAGFEYTVVQLCILLDVDPKTINWDAGSETFDGDVRSVLAGVMVRAYGDEWAANSATATRIRSALVSAPAKQESVVKALEWEEGDNGLLYAKCVFGVFEINERYSSVILMIQQREGLEIVLWRKDFPDLTPVADLMAAAQTELDLRIRPGLVSAPPTYADAEAKGLEKAATAYTSGPWSRFADDLTVIAGGVVVGKFHPETPNRANTNGTPLEEAKANAKLAAASPEMLRALRIVLPTFEELFPDGAGTASIRAAIASAEGTTAIRSLASPAPKGET